MSHPNLMREFINNCANCHNICMETVAHCLQMGDKHAEASHIRLLLDCVEICATSANVMLRQSDLHPRTCAVSTEVCVRGADDCERSGPDAQMMLRCAEVCRRCADSCRRMAA